MAAFASQLGAVIGQVQMAPEADEITAALALLKSLPLAGAIVTGDAAFCQRAICQGVRDRKGDYLFTVKANQPQLMADIALAFASWTFSSMPNTGPVTPGILAPLRAPTQN